MDRRTMMTTLAGGVVATGLVTRANTALVSATTSTFFVAATGRAWSARSISPSASWRRVA